jgi:outer membrane lipoprotein LolB
MPQVKRAAWLALLFLWACAQVELRPPEQVDFDLLGRISARYRDDGFTGNVTWRHAAAGDEMLITTPLGQGVARIVRQGDAVHLTTAEGKEFRAPDSESLTERVLGFRLPIEGLADWVRGRPSPALEGRGWKVEYLQRDERNRPRLMRMTYQGVEVRFAVTEWR